MLTAEILEALAEGVAAYRPRFLHGLGIPPSLERVAPAPVVRVLPGVFQVEVEVNVLHELQHLAAYDKGRAERLLLGPGHVQIPLDPVAEDPELRIGAEPAPQVHEVVA